MPHQEVKSPMRWPIVLRQRLPFLPLVGLAALGITASDWLALSLWVWLTLLGAALLGFAVFRNHERARFGAFAVLVASVFAITHLWQDRDAPAAYLAQQIGSGTPLVEVTGTVANKPRVFSERSASFSLRVEEILLEGQTWRTPITILVRWPGAPPAYGDKFRLTGVLQNLPPPRNPGQFDFAAWAARQGNYSQLEISHPYDAHLLARDQGSPLLAMALRLRESMAQRLSAGIDDPVVSDLILAMVLGDTSTMPEAIQKEFRGTGTFHLFSVSGLHVGILSVILWYILRTFSVPQSIAAFIIIPALFFYALMTGFQAASVRSAIMASIMLAGFFFNRQPILLNNLCAAGFLILLFDPNQLFNAGFQLSFTVVAIILLLAKTFTTTFKKPFQPDPFIPNKLLNRWQIFVMRRGYALAGLVAVSLAAWMGSLPLTLHYFNLISLSALPANLIAVPLSFGIMAIATLSLGISFVSPWAGEIFNQTNWLLTKGLLAIIHFFAGIPSSYLYLAPPQDKGPLAEIVVFDAGSGGATWLQSRGKAWMIDAGSVRFEESPLLPFLRQKGRMNLDGLIISHGDAAHIAGAAQLLEDCPPRLVIDSALNDRSAHRDRFQKALAARHQPKSIYRAGDRLRISDTTTLHVLYPPSGIANSLADDKALVLRFDIGNTCILFMSDSGAHTERWLLENSPEELRCDILVKGLPRSGPSGEAEFLDAVAPQAIIASSTTFPAGELIPDQWAQSVAARGIRLYRQDLTGAVTIRIFPESWEITDFLSKTKTIFSP